MKTPLLVLRRALALTLAIGLAAGPAAAVRAAPPGSSRPDRPGHPVAEAVRLPPLSERAPGRIGVHRVRHVREQALPARHRPPAGLHEQQRAGAEGVGVCVKREGLVDTGFEIGYGGGAVRETTKNERQ